MPASIHRLLPRFTSKQLHILPSYYPSIPSSMISHWILKDSFDIHINSERSISTEHLDNQSTWNWPNGLLWSSGWSMFQFRKPPTPYSPISHDHPLQTFPSDKDTPPSPYALLLAWLPSYVKQYCKSIYTCSCTKPVHHKPMEISSNFWSQEAWNSISMDFIEKHLHLPVTPQFWSLWSSL